jgi:hypothetical protein
VRTAILIVAGSVISFLALLLIALTILKVKPALFGVRAESDHAAQPVAIDAVVHRRPDSIVAGTSKVMPTPPAANSDSLLLHRMKERSDNLQHQVDSLKRALTNPTKTAVQNQPRDWAATAKLMDTMNPEDAGKILKQMNDDDVRKILAKIKKKQAGKILSTLEPNRAARILR